MRITRRITAFLLAVALVISTMTSAFAYYDDYASTTNTKISNICQQYVYQYDYVSRTYKQVNTLRMTVNWSNIQSYSFNNENWYDNCNQSYRTFYIREDYYNKTPASGVEVVLPKSVNVLFLYVKEYGSSTIKVFQYKLSGGDLSFIYGNNAVPTHIISVTDAIDLLPSKANVKLTDEPKVIAARNAYNALGIDKIWVYNAHKLFDLESQIDALKSAAIDWTKIYKDLDNANPGKLTEQYYNVPNKLYADLYVQADKTKIYQTKIGIGPRYNLAQISTDVYNDTTPTSNNVFFTYNFSHSITGGIYSPAMAKKVWGFFTPTATGAYQFKITSDDGHNWVMYLDDGTRLQNSNFRIQDYTTTITSAFNLHDISDYTTGNFNLKANVPYPLYIEYFNHGGNGALKLQYRIMQDDGTVTPWADMKGSIFKPSTAYEFGFQAGNAAELQRLVNIAQGLVTTYDRPDKIGTTEGKVSQDALDALKAKLAEAKIALDNAIAGKMTQAQIDEAAAKLQAAIDAFNNAIVKKPNGISVPAAVQNGNYVTVSFNKDTTVNTYEIIISKDNTISADDKVYSLTNGNFVLNNNTSINVVQGELNGTLTKLDTANGKYRFDIPINDYMAQGSVSVFIRTATGDNKGDASAFAIGLLKQPTAFSYAVSDDSIIFYTLDPVKDYGFAIDYYAPGASVMTRTYVTASGKDYLVVPKAQVDLSRISSASLYRIVVTNNSPNFAGGHSVPLVGPTKVEIPTVNNLKLSINNGQYALDWEAFKGATGYELYVGDTADTSTMSKISDTALTNNTYSLGTYTNNNIKYYAVRALITSDMYARTGFSNVVKVVKPTAPDVIKKGNKTEVRSLVPTDSTRYVIKADGKTKGYYLISMPVKYLKMAGADQVVSNANGSYLVTFPEVAGQSALAYDKIASIDYTTESTLGDNTGIVTYKVPYTENTDVAITLEAVKHDQKTAVSQVISLVKYASDDGKSIWGISDSASINMQVEVNRPDISSTLEISGATVVNDSILTILGDEFTITYKYHVNAKEVYNPNFIFELKDNQYFSYDYPTVSGYYMENGTKVVLKNEAIVTRDTANNLTKVVMDYKGDPTTNLSDKDIYVTVKVKPIVNLNTNILTLALNSKAIDSSNNAWELPYGIANVKDANGKSVFDGMSISNNIEFDTVSNSISDLKSESTEKSTLKLQFTNKNKAKTSF